MSGEPYRLDLRFRIEWEGNWHVGSGFGSAQADRLIRRQGGRNGLPFVPGSQIKGVLRHQAERLAASFGCRVAMPHATDPDQQVHLIEAFRPLHRSGWIVDRLFGSRYQGECLFVDDAVADPALIGPRQGPAAQLRTRATLDRATGTVREQRLFTTELADPSVSALRGTVRARHPADQVRVYDLFPLEYALLVVAMNSITALGGDKSIGEGYCRLIIEEPLTWMVGPQTHLYQLSDALKPFESGEWEDQLQLVEEGSGS